MEMNYTVVKNERYPLWYCVDEDDKICFVTWDEFLANKWIKSRKVMSR